jgi:hypothetical protein
LRTPELAGLPFGSATVFQEYTVDLSDQSVREREAVSETAQAVFESGDVVGDLGHIVQRNTRRFLQFEQQQVGKRRLRAFDLRRKHCLLPHVGVEKQLSAWQEGGDTVQPTEGEQGAVQALTERGLDGEWRLGRQVPGHEGPDDLVANRRDRDVIAGGSAVHGSTTPFSRFAPRGYLELRFFK